MTEVALPRSPAPPALADGLVDGLTQAARNPFWAYVMTLDSPQSRVTMRKNLNRLACQLDPGLEAVAGRNPGQFYPWHEIGYDRALAIRSMLLAHPVSGQTGKPISDAYVHAFLVALRGVLQQCRILRLISRDDLDDLLKATRPPKVSRLPAGRELGDDDIGAVVGVRSEAGTVIGIRDAALLAVLASTGMRRSEAAAALTENYSPRTRNLLITGKGNKQRIVRVDEGAVLYLNPWLRLLPRSGPMFPNVYKSGRIGDRAITGDRVQGIVLAACKAAGITDIHSHDFRRTLMTVLLRVYGNPVAAGRIAGHADVRTTAMYDMSKIEEALDMADRLGRSYGPARHLA